MGTRKLKVKKKKKPKKKKHWVHTINNTNSINGNVESTATILVIGDALKIKMKKKKMIRQQNTKTEYWMESATIAVRKGI